MRIIFSFLILFFSHSALSFVLEGEVGGLYISDMGADGSGVENDFFTVKGTGASAAGSCFAYNDGKTINTAVFLRDDNGGNRMLSLVLAAQLAGKTIKVTVDENLKSVAGSNYCLASWVGIAE